VPRQGAAGKKFVKNSTLSNILTTSIPVLDSGGMENITNLIVP